MIATFSKALALTVALIGNAAIAQGYPAKPIRLIVPYPAGGSMDVSARVFAAEVSGRLGQPMIVENMAGAAGTLGAAFVARQPADGYTLCYCVTGVMTITPLLDSKVPYKPLEDFAHVSHLYNMENMLMARADLPANDLPSLIALSKQKAGGLTYGTPGSGGTHHLGAEMLKNQTGANIRHIPYKGEGPAVNDLMAGTIDLVFGSAPVAFQMAKAGKVKIIANLGSQRSSLVPEVKTVAESGFADYGWYNFAGLDAPAKTSPEIVNRLAKAASEALGSPAFRAKLQGMGIRAVGSTPEEYSTFLTKETARWSSVLQYTKVERD